MDSEPDKSCRSPAVELLHDGWLGLLANWKNLIAYTSSHIISPIISPILYGVLKGSAEKQVEQSLDGYTLEICFFSANSIVP